MDRAHALPPGPLDLALYEDAAADRTVRRASTLWSVGADLGEPQAFPLWREEAPEDGASFSSVAGCEPIRSSACLLRDCLDASSALGVGSRGAGRGRSRWPRRSSRT